MPESEEMASVTEKNTLQEEYIEWLVMPEWEREIKSQAEWGRIHNRSAWTLTAWKKDPAFRRKLEARCDSVNLGPDRVQEVINAVFRSAKDGDMKAAALYLQHADRLAPKRVVIEDRKLSAMSDVEFQAALQEHGLLT